MAYTDLFGGNTLEPAAVAYRAVALDDDVTLVWPPYSTTTTDYVARIMDVTPDDAGYVVTMPAASLISPGQDILWNNLGSDSFTVSDAGGNELFTLDAGGSRYLYLEDNSTEAGEWGTVLFGAAASALDASQLRGAGLTVVGGQLAYGPTVSTLSGNYTVNAVTDRAKTIVQTGGTATLTLPLLSSVASGFVIELRNQGSGVWTVAPVGGDVVDGSATITLAISESCLLHAGPTAWYTVGRGRNTQFNFTRLVKSITGGTTTLSLTEAANVVQLYTGILASNQTVVVPSVVQVYYVSNYTTGAHTVTFQSPIAGGVGVVVDQGQNAVLFCDGTDMYDCNTNGSGSGTFTFQLAPGSAASPSLSFSADTATGLFQPASGELGVTLSGTQVALYSALGVFFNPGINAVSVGATLPGSGSFTALTLSTGLSTPAGVVTPTQLGYVFGAASNIQAQINGLSPVVIGTPYDNGNSGAAKTITLANGLKQKITLNAATPALTFDFTGAPTATYLIKIVQDATGGRVPSYVGLSSTNWLSSATQPGINLTASKETMLGIYWDGTEAVQSISKVGAA